VNKLIDPMQSHFKDLQTTMTCMVHGVLPFHNRESNNQVHRGEVALQE
jgi:hypothetical protein